MVVDYTFDFTSDDFETEKVKERIFMKNWNPVSNMRSYYLYL